MANDPVGGSGPWVMDQWTYVDLTPLAGAATLTFSFSAGSASQSNSIGILNPTFFAADNLVLAPAPEPSTLALSLIAGLCAAAVAARRKMRRAIG